MRHAKRLARLERISNPSDTDNGIVIMWADLDTGQTIVTMPRLPVNTVYTDYRQGLNGGQHATQ